MHPRLRATRDSPALHLTGERTLPGIEEENYWFARHVAAYRLAIDQITGVDVANTHVLDSGCGEGYGAAMLADAGAACVGLDAFADVAAHAVQAYPEANFVQADAKAGPFPDAMFDLVTSMQVIEHLADPDAYVRECCRLLKPRGTFLCTTPNRLTFTPPGRPKNPFHTTEFSATELRDLLARHFDEVVMEGLHDEFPGLADALTEAASASERPPGWATDIGRMVRPDYFHVTNDVETSLDLVATCRLR